MTALGPAARARAVRGRTPGELEQLPGQLLACAQGHKLLVTELQALRHRPFLPGERYRACIGRQAVKAGAENAGEALQAVEGACLFEGDGVELERRVAGIDAGAAASGFLVRARVRSAIGTEEELGIAGSRRLH